jgi:hypothetical protein
MSFSSRHKLLLVMPRIGDFCREEYDELHFKKFPLFSQRFPQYAQLLEQHAYCLLFCH